MGWSILLIEQLAYLNDPLTLEFEAKIVRKGNDNDGQIEVILEQTYFYPTGGGQMHDTGTLGEARVIDVFKDATGSVVHRVDRDITGSKVPAKIDYDRRLGNMQHHSAQHILSRSLEKLLELDTLSAKISADTPSTIDVQMTDVRQADLERVERFANGIIFENRPIKSYFITDDQIQTVPFRRPPKVKGKIRVVEVDSFDYSACGGTHCLYTGMVGLIKIVKTEHKNKKLRIYFVAGNQALRYFQNYYTIITEISRNLSTSPEEVTHIVNWQIEQLQLAQQEMKNLSVKMLSLEAQQLIIQAKKFDPYRLILATYIDRPLSELRELGKLLQKEADVIAVLAGYDGQKLSLVVSCTENVGVSARELLTQHLAQIDGKGGGDDKIAQGGGLAIEQQIETFFNNTQDYIVEKKQP